LHPQFGVGVWVNHGIWLERKTKKKFIDRLDRAHYLDLRKIKMMKLGKKSGHFPEGKWRQIKRSVSGKLEGVRISEGGLESLYQVIR